MHHPAAVKFCNGGDGGNGLQAELPLLDSRQDTRECDYRSRYDGPKRNVQDLLVEVRLRRRCDCDQRQGENGVARPPVVFVDCLRVVLSTVELRYKVLCEADYCLDEEKDVGDQAEYGVRGFEVGAVVGCLVVYDHDESAE